MGHLPIRGVVESIMAQKQDTIDDAKLYRQMSKNPIFSPTDTDDEVVMKAKLSSKHFSDVLDASTISQKASADLMNATADEQLKKNEVMVALSAAQLDPSEANHRELNHKIREHAKAMIASSDASDRVFDAQPRIDKAVKGFRAELNSFGGHE